MRRIWDDSHEPGADTATITLIHEAPTRPVQSYYVGLILTRIDGQWLIDDILYENAASLLAILTQGAATGGADP